MFHGRKKELEILERTYRSQDFKMVVVYGRRRVGKSYLLSHFFHTVGAKFVGFQAVENSRDLSIEAFRDAMLEVFPSEFGVALDSWKECFRYFNNHLGEERVILFIDEINYAFKADPTFASQLQNEIDNHLMGKNVMLIVCGSNVATMEQEILNESSPLYGRRNLSIKLSEFSYREAAEFYPSYSNEEKIAAYSVFGGKGKYLACIDPSVSVKDNIITQILSPGGALSEEVDLLLKDDFRDPVFYKELLRVLSLGYTSFNDIQAQLHTDSAKVATYLAKLESTRIIVKHENQEGKKKDNRYYIQDHFFAFYFRYVYKRANVVNILATPEAFYARFIEPDLSAFIGLQFEKICTQYIIDKSYRGELPFIPTSYGKYFGRHRDGRTFDIDVLFKDDEYALVGECKFTNRHFSSSDLHELEENAAEIQAEKKLLYAFCKSGADVIVLRNHPELHVVSLNDLFA